MVIIPENAKKVFDGILFSVWQYPQTMFDGSVKMFELAKRPDTVLIFPTDGDQIYLGFEKQPHFDDFALGFLGGRMDAHETPLMGAKRELLEETGMVSDDWSLWFRARTGSKLDHSVYFFIARGAQRVAEQQLDPGGEIVTLKTIGFGDFVEKIIAGDLGRGDFRADILYRKLHGTLGAFQDALFGGKDR